MLSPVLSLKPQNTTTSILFSKNTTGSKYLNESNTNQYHSPITNFNLSPSYMYFRQLFTIQLSRSTRISSTITLLHPSVTSSLKFANSSIAIAVPPLRNRLPPALRQISDPSYELTSCYLSTALSLQT